MTHNPSALPSVFDKLREAGISTPDALRKFPALHDTLHKALYDHAVHFASLQENEALLRRINMTAEDAGNELWIRIFSEAEERHGSSGHPAHLLEVLRDQGTSAACHYLSRILHLGMRQILNEHERIRETPAPTGGTDAGGPEETVMKRQLLLSMLRRMGSDFMVDTALLGHALGMGPKLVAWSFATGRHEQLVHCIIRELSDQLGQDCTEACASLLEASRRFTLPESCRSNEAAILRLIQKTPANMRPMAVGEFPRRPGSQARPPLSRHPMQDDEDKPENDPLES